MSLTANVQEKANMIWNTADILVGNYKPHEYGNVILPMTVLKRFDSVLEPTKEAVWYYVKFEDNLNFCFLTNPKKFVPLSIDYGSLSLRTHFLLLFKLPALAAA